MHDRPHNKTKQARESQHHFLVSWIVDRTILCANMHAVIKGAMDCHFDFGEGEGPCRCACPTTAYNNIPTATTHAPVSSKVILYCNDEWLLEANGPTVEHLCIQLQSRGRGKS